MYIISMQFASVHHNCDHFISRINIAQFHYTLLLLILHTIQIVIQCHSFIHV